ncbi:MAG: tRNA(His) guanylyltransferase Thg1 family protein [Thermoprotei archaeon]
MTIDFNYLEQYFRSKEIFSGLRVDAPFIIRVDGNNFHKLAKDLNLKKPFDKRFHELMIQVVEDFMRNIGFNVVLAYTFSDEINYLYLGNVPFNGRVEKLLTITASYTASIFANKIEDLTKRSIGFDGRIVKVDGINDIINYLIWRSAHSYRNFLNSYAQAYIHEDLTNVKGPEIVSKLYTLGIDINSIDSWEKFGTVVIREQYVKEGVNQLTGSIVHAVRIKLARYSIDFTKKDSQVFIQNLLLQWSKRE